jgi:sucrose-phosphate synthase
VFCLPAEYEPFGLNVVEAMAVGLPVVATSNGGPREITNEGNAGLMADPHDPTDIAAKLLRLFSERTPADLR